MCVFGFLCNVCVKRFEEEEEEYMIINAHRSVRKAPVILVRFQWYFNFLDILRKILKYKLYENPPSGSTVVPYGRTYRQT